MVTCGMVTQGWISVAMSLSFLTHALFGPITNVSKGCEVESATSINLNVIDEIGTWRPVRYRIGRPYMKEYHKHFPISSPEADWDDRNALYAM